MLWALTWQNGTNLKNQINKNWLQRQTASKSFKTQTHFSITTEPSGSLLLSPVQSTLLAGMEFFWAVTAPSQISSTTSPPLHMHPFHVPLAHFTFADNELNKNILYLQLL